MIHFFVAQALVVTAGVALLWAWWIRRHDVGLVVVLCGAAAFVASQAVRLPLLAGLGAVTDLAEPVMVGVAILTSGLVEEPARWLVLRALARARGWADGVGFGLGHGGIEALLVVGIGAIGAIVLLTGGDEIVAQLRAQDPAQADAAAAQVAAVRDVGAGEVVLAVVERASAITFHVAATLLVVQSLRTRRLSWLGAAIAAHWGFNALALGLLALAGPLATEVALAVVAVLLLLVIRRARPHLQPETGPVPDSSAQVVDVGVAEA